MNEIDKTIEKLLQRGADPNISEVPKPTIHLGVYTKDLKMICTLLMRGACPDSQLYPNEGLLTPLHVIVLQEPDERNICICELLLYFAANPELETSPEFSISEEEKVLLDSECGRTPLQLLCMRPDLEFGDQNDILLRIGLLLANVSDKRHFYNGHSCLTLAMLVGNIKILKNLLDCKCFDPNDILGNDRGTTLHVLVSTELQKIMPYETSIRMCDLLIEKGADPLKTFDQPEKLIGTCVDYGYREIEAEKEARKANAAKKDSKGSKGKEKVGKDHLKDHERVVEYLRQIAANMAKFKEIDCNLRKKLKTSSRMVRQDPDITDEKEVVSKENRKKDRSRGKEASLTEGQEKKESLSAGNPEGKKNSLGAEKTRKESSGKQETSEKKEKERKGKGEKTKEERTSEIKENRQLTEKEIDDYCKKKMAEKRESEKIKAGEKRKTGTRSTDKTKSFQKPNQKVLGSKSQGTRPETFPEKLRQVFLQLYGTRYEIDINELLVPYVVLRNGELYYRFHKESSGQKEQYSLI